MVEILVVVAIVAMVAALLVPAFDKMAMQAEGVECLSNQSQWVKALHLYLAENENRLPVSAYQVGSSTDATVALYPYLGSRSRDEAWESTFCPTRKLNRSGTAQTSLWGTYAFNSFVSGMSMAALPEQSKLIYLTDGVGGSRWASYSVLTGKGSRSFAEGVPRPHRGRVNVTYLDGHSEPVRVSDLTWASFTRGTSTYFDAHEDRKISTENFDK